MLSWEVSNRKKYLYVQGSQEYYAFPENAFLYIAFLGSAFRGTSLLGSVTLSVQK